MRLTRVRLVDVRNYAALDLAPAPGLNVFAGPNAQGKSNLLEAIAMLGTGRSFRTAHESEIVREGTGLAQIAGHARVAAGTLELSCEIRRVGNGTRKSYTVNGTPVRFGAFLGRVPVVTFVPGDLALARGGPALRRALLNAALAQSLPGYYRHLVRYTKIVAQKSAALRGLIPVDRELLRTYNDEVAPDAAALFEARRAYVEELAPAAARAYARIAGDAETFAVTYRPSGGLDTVGREALTAAFAERFERELPNEIARRAVLIGPHRDDLAFLLDGASLGAFGSQGQIRSATLALKVAEYEVLCERAGEAPVLLLDDVLSELDAERAHRFLDALVSCEQVFLTTTELDPALVPSARRYAILDATVTAC